MSAEVAALVQALRRLPPSHRQVLVLHHALDLPVSEVARQLGLTSGTVRGRLFRARTRLRDLLSANAEEVDSSHG
jgi:RNA polymerase sigma-70 factor, ECF subfamily